MTMTLTRADAWAVRRNEQDKLAAMKVERRLVFALHGEDGHERAQELDYLMVKCEATIREKTNEIIDWTGACLEGEPCSTRSSSSPSSSPSSVAALPQQAQHSGAST